MSEVMFESSRCFVRPFQRQDIQLFAEYRNNSEWMKYQGFKDKSVKEYEEILLKEPDIIKGFQYAIISKASNMLIGDLYIKKSDNEFRFGYTINPIFKRQGYTFEIASSMIKWINSQGDYRIVAGVDKENTPSVNLLKKLGFKFKESLEDEDVYVYQEGSDIDA